MTAAPRRACPGRPRAARGHARAALGAHLWARPGSAARVARRARRTAQRSLPARRLARPPLSPRARGPARRAATGARPPRLGPPSIQRRAAWPPSGACAAAAGSRAARGTAPRRCARGPARVGSCSVAPGRGHGTRGAHGRPEHALEAVREVAERAIEVRAPRELHHLAQGFARRVRAATPPVRRLCGAAGRPGRCNECSSECKDA